MNAKTAIAKFVTTYLKIGFLSLSRHSGLDPESSDFAVLPL